MSVQTCCQAGASCQMVTRGPANPVTRSYHVPLFSQRPRLHFSCLCSALTYKIVDSPKSSHQDRIKRLQTL